MNGRYEADNEISRVFAQKVDRQFRKDFAKYLPPSRKPEESKSKINELSIKLIEAEEKIALLQRTVETKNHEIDELQNSEKNALCKIEEFQEHIRHLKSELDRKHQTYNNVNEDKLKEKVLLSDYRTALSKYLTWHTYADKQMEVMRTFLQEVGGWTEENRYKIYFAYKGIPPVNVKDDNIAELCKLSVLDYCGVEDVESISEFEQHLKFHNISTQTDRFESGFIQCSQDSQEPCSQEPSSQQQESFHNLSADDLRFLEHNERIQKLECENANLKEQLIILNQKCKDNGLWEEEKKNLESQLSNLKRMNETLEKKILELDTYSKAGITTSFSSDESKRIAQFFKQKYQKEIVELKQKLSEFQPLHPSETTCVYRFQMDNPLDEAHDEHLINLATQNATAVSNKRRKLDSTNSDDECSSKSVDLELIKSLRAKIEQHEGLLKDQKDFLLQYRKIVSLLTGYQIKLRDEGLCEVQSVYDNGGNFCFKKRSDDAIDLLDNEYAWHWKSHVTNYLAKYDSVPAFLASILLALVENDASMLSQTFLNYTKDPQQEEL